jgi:hypothetical protein
MRKLRFFVAGAAMAVGLVAFAPSASAADGCTPYLGPDLYGARCVVDVNGTGAAFTPTVLSNGGTAVGGGVCTGTNTSNPTCVHYLVMQGPGSFSYYDVCYGNPYQPTYTCVL